MIYLNKIIKNLIYINLTILITLVFFFYYFNKNKIGDEPISIIKKDFLCSYTVYQYYSTDLYLTEFSLFKSKMKKELKNLFIPNVSTISIRFIINCRGEVDGFFCESFDENYLKKNIDDTSLNSIVLEIKKLNNLITVKNNNKNVNAYILLRIKVKDGKIYDIF